MYLMVGFTAMVRYFWDKKKPAFADFFPLALHELSTSGYPDNTNFEQQILKSQDLYALLF